MRQGGCFNLEDVVRHLPGRDAPLRWMYTPHGVPLRPRQIAEVRILQSQVHSVNGRSASGDPTIKAIVVDIGRLGNENRSARGKQCWN